jgi:hypothetical protein
MQDRWGHLAPLTGVVFAALVFIGFLSAGTRAPDADSAPAKIIAYYVMHGTEVKTTDILFVLAFLFLIWWAGALRSYIRHTPATEGLSAFVLVGGVLMGAGVMITAGVEYGLADNIRHLGPEAAQVLNLLSLVLFLPILAGALLFEISSGLAILRGAMLPKSLGWAAITLAIVALIPPAYEIALLGFAAWCATASVLVYARARSPAEVSQRL